MSIHQNNNGDAGKAAAQLKAAAEILEKAVGNRALLAELSEEERTRLLKAAGEIYCPEVNERRRLVKAKVRQRKAEKISARPVQAQPDGHPQTAPRKSFHDAECFSAARISSSRKSRTIPDFREVVEPQNCYICKKDYSTHPPFLRPALPGMRGVEFFQAHGDGGFARARGAAHRRAREDRLSGRHQTAARRRAADCQHTFSARLGDALCAGAGFQGLEAPAGNFRAGSAPHAERRGVLPTSAGHAESPGLHHQ